jgi:FkbM family methyltransferase
LKGEAAVIEKTERSLMSLAQITAFTQQRRVAVQAGGNYGVWPKYLSQRFEHVYTFEPCRSTFVDLVENVRDCFNVCTLNAALTDVRGPVSLVWDVGSKHNAGTVYVSASCSGKVPALLLDDLKLGVCDLLCLDVEGYELRAVRGALETIERCRPVISVEINKCIERAGDTADDLRMLLTSLGYDCALRVHADEVFVHRG